MEDFTPPGQRTYGEREEQRVQAIEDEEQREEEAQENEAVTVDEEGNVDAKDQDRQGTKTDTDLDGTKEESPGVAVGGLPGDFESGKADQQRTEVIAEQKQGQLEEKKQTIQGSSATSFQTGSGDTISKDQAVSQVDQQIQEAEKTEEQARSNIETIERNQEIREENREIRQANSIAEAERFFDQQEMEEQAQENKEKLREQILESQREEETKEQVTFVERGLNTVEEAGQDLALIADREKDVVGEASEEVGAENVGNDFAALFETVAGAKPVVQEARSFDTDNPVESLGELAETGKEEIIDPAATAFTDADEVGLIEPSEDLQERTKDIQGTAASTPLDTAGFVGAAGAGAGTIFAEELSRSVTRGGRILGPDEDFGRDFREGEGLERLTVGTGVLADAVSEKPGEFAQEEITQESTEALVGLGAPTLTVTARPSDLTSRFEGTVRTAGQKAKTAGTKLKDSVTDPNALGSGAGALLPSETQTQTPTKDTVEVDTAALDAFEVDPLSPETIPSSQTNTPSTSPGSSFTTAATPTTTAEPRTETLTDTVSEPQNISQGRPGTLTDTVSQTQSLSQTPSLTNTLTDTISQSTTATDTPTATPSLTDTPTATPTPTPTLEFDDGTDLLTETSSETGKENSSQFLPSVDALLTGERGKVDEDEVFSGFETRPLQEL